MSEPRSRRRPDRRKPRSSAPRRKAKRGALSGRLCLCLVLTLSTVLLLAAACGGEEGPAVEQPSLTPPATASSQPTSTSFPGIRSEVVVPDAQFPVKLAFAPDGRLFYSELGTGNIRVISADGQLLPEPFAHVNVAEFQLWGLFGLAFDPEFDTNHYVYAYFIEPTLEGGGRAVVMRFTDSDNTGTDATVIGGDLAESGPMDETPHVGGNIMFGPDGYLYVSLGDFAPFAETIGARIETAFNAQNLGILPGKILRVDKKDGSPPPDNPFVNLPDADPRIFTYGLRNVFDFTFHPQTGQLYANDNGPENCDELNLVTKGENYGWPLSFEFGVEDCSKGQPVPPIHVYARPGMKGEELGSSVAPTAIQFVTGDLYPSLAGSLLICEWNTGFMRALVLGGENQDEVLSDDVVAEDCQLDIAVSPDGIIYYSNSSEIRRLLPE